MNSDVNPEVEMFNRVAALMGTTLTEADVHRFLLEAAEFLGEGSLSMYGPNVFFRWQLGERVIEIEPGYRPWGEEYSLTVDSYNRGFPIDTQERLIYKYGDADLYPYLWRVDLGGEVTDWWGPGEAYVVNWELFEETTAKTLGGLPNDMALMPPQWRRPFTFRWDMGESGLGLVSFTGTVDGLMVTAETTGDQVLIPRDLLRSEGARSVCATSSPAWPEGALSSTFASPAPRASATTASSPPAPAGTRMRSIRTLSSSFWRTGERTRPGPR